MAFPVVAATNESSTNTAGTSHTVNLPTGIAAGHLLIVCLDKGSTSATVNALTGWTELLDEASANGLYIAYRWADGTEGSTITLTTSASTRSAEITFRITGAQNPATQAPQIGTTGTGTSATPDPPAVTPTGGAKDYLWIAFFGAAGEELDDDTWSDTPPASFTPSPPLQKSCGTAGTNLGGLIAAASRQFNGATLNPGTFAKDVSAAWRSQTIAVHPAPPTGTGLGAFTFSGTASGAASIASDDFNRTDANPIGGNWTTVTAEGAMQIVSNAATPASTSNDSAAYWNADTFADDQWSECDATVTGSNGGTGPGPMVRAATGAETFYRVTCDHSATGIGLDRFVAGGFTNLWTRAATFVNGDRVRLRVVGSTLAVFINGVQVGADHVDGSPIASGQPGIAFSSGGVSAATLDNWAAGEVGGAATIDATATIVGVGVLAGTVVQGVTATLAGAGVLTAPAVQRATATLTGAGVLAATVTQRVTATLTGAGVVAAPSIQRAPSSPTGAGALTALVTQGATATLAGAGVLSASATVTGGTINGTATITGAGVLNAPATQGAIATLTGTGALTAQVTQGVTATLTGAGVLSATSVQRAGATPTGTGVVSASATVTGGTVNATAALVGAGTVTAVVSQQATSSLAGAGALSAAGYNAGTATLAGAGTLAAAATQGATAALAGAGVLVAVGSGGVAAINATAALVGAGVLSAAVDMCVFYPIPTATTAPTDSGTTDPPDTGETEDPC